ncbi:anaerobic ribonucleoside-triphosphate reductase [uncultured Campylobacter sp.]|uniref:anaerobic ribonucleoside-triphosphate reductase n=1 Tax=uncultured Campylobacter sp. TaxID=218934 RepID=UPI003211A920
MTNSEILESLQEKRTKCTVWSRVMGYHRPVEGFNIGKKGEHKERAFFKENKLKRIANGKF